MAETTRNAFLGGEVQVTQPVSGYRAGVDPVILAASVPAKPGQSVLELGCGVGTALLCLGARVPGLSLSGVELQSDYASLAAENAVQNNQPLTLYCDDISNLPKALKAQRFDHILANPPYFKRDESEASPDLSRETGRGERLPLLVWVATAARRLSPGGTASFIQRVERLPELLSACDGLLGSVEVLPLLPRTGRPAKLVLLRARKGGRAAFRLLAPVALHQGAFHTRDGDDYAPQISEVLRNGAALSFEAALQES